jgi:methionyl-tRNA synthetase
MTPPVLSAFYITTAIPYVNAPPHLGFALEAVLADVIARHRRLRGDEVRFQSGTDDNSLKNVRAAEQAGVATETLVRQNAARFAGLASCLALSYDDFLGTSVDERHRRGVVALWRACRASGDLYKRRYRGLYCLGCEAFCNPDELPDGRCPEHGSAPEVVEEENWFFRLSRHRDRILRLIESGALAITPASSRNEVLAFLRAGLEDVSVSRATARARGWGIPVPDDDSQVVYVWLDALGNYINALDWAGQGAAYGRFWSGPGRRVHVVGKGIVRFHAVIWPALLLSAGLPLPTDLVVHGYLTVEGQKIGKSRGNAVDPEELVARFGRDAVRHFLLRHVRPFADSDFSEARLRAARDAELADQLGNLVRRTVTLLQRQPSGAPPTTPSVAQAPDQELRARAGRLPAALDEAFARFATDEGLGAVFDFIAATNRYLEQTAPWKLHGDPGRLLVVLGHAREAVRIGSLALAPFLPETAEAITTQLGERPPIAGTWPEALRWREAAIGCDLALPPGGPVLFPKT